MNKSAKDYLGYFVNVVIHPRTPKPDYTKKIIACVGDSLTYGAGVRLTRKKDSYPARLQGLLGEEWQVLNYGLSWRTLQNSGDLPYRADRFYQQSLGSGAEIFLLMLGSNDAKVFNWNEENYRRELTDFTRTYCALPQQPTVILMQPTIVWRDRNGNEPYQMQVDLVGNELHEIVAEVGKETDCPVIDLYRLSKAHQDWFYDLAHPNVKGNMMIAHYIYSALIDLGQI